MDWTRCEKFLAGLVAVQWLAALVWIVRANRETTR